MLGTSLLLQKNDSVCNFTFHVTESSIKGHLKKVKTDLSEPHYTPCLMLRNTEPPSFVCKGIGEGVVRGVQGSGQVQPALRLDMATNTCKKTGEGKCVGRHKFGPISLDKRILKQGISHDIQKWALDIPEVSVP